MTRIFTIGYEDATMADFLAALTSAHVKQVLDIRAIAVSSRPGFSKSALAATLREAGIDYVHLRALGTPKAGREAARKGDRAGLSRIYADQLKLPEAQAEVAKMHALAREKLSALLCYERDPAACHRTVLLAMEGEGLEATDLFT